MRMKQVVAVMVAMVAVLGVSSVQASVLETEDFEAYTLDDQWFPGGPPTAGTEGWTVSQEVGTPTFSMDHGYGGNSLRFYALASPPDESAEAKWYVSADKNVYPQQTFYFDFEGVQLNAQSFGRLFFNKSNSNFLEIDSYDRALLRHATGDYTLPEDVESWVWDTTQTGWYAAEIQMDYSLNKIRARIGRRPNLATTNWNSYTPWLDMRDSDQQPYVQMSVNGRVHTDNFRFTATPEPAALGLLALGSLLTWAGRKRRR